MELPKVFTDTDGEPLRFFLPMSLVARNTFKEKIEQNGGVIVSSELMNNIIKIGDPAKPQSYDASWLNFRYIDDALRLGALQDPEYYVMDNPQQLSLSKQRRITPSSGGLPNGIGSRGTRQEFTPQEDDILRRIVHRPGVATSGNKIYQLIAEQYGGHSFHSWRDRYIRHMRPIWGPPTDDCAMDLHGTDDFILTQSFLRAPHVSQVERPGPSGSTRLPDFSEEEMTPMEPRITAASNFKKQRAAFSSTDDEILLRAIKENGETAATYRALGERHKHHTWESWKNRVKALKKRHDGGLPDPDRGRVRPSHDQEQDQEQEQEQDMSAHGLASLSNASMGLSANLPPHSQELDNTDDAVHNIQDHDQLHQEVDDPNIDPSLQLQLGMIMHDANQTAFEAQFPNVYDPTQDMQMPQQQGIESPSSFDFHSHSTEDMLRHNLQGHTTQDLDIPQHLANQNLGLQSLGRGLKRQINIHDPTLDEDAGRVSDIDDESQGHSYQKRSVSKRTGKKRKTNAAAYAAALRAAAVPKLAPVPLTPSHQVQQKTSSNPKSAKLEHHQRAKPSMIPALSSHGSQTFLMDDAGHRSDGIDTPDASVTSATLIAKHNEKPMGVDFETLDQSAMVALLSDHAQSRDDLHHIPRADATDDEDDEAFLRDEAFIHSQFHASRGTLKNARTQPLEEVRGTPGSSPVQVPVSQLRVATDGPDYSNAFEAPSPTPTSPKAYSHSQLLQDPEAIRTDNELDEYGSSIREETQPEDQQLQDTIQAAYQQRMQNWVDRQVAERHIPAADALDAWHRTSGVQSIASKVVQAYAEGRSPPRIPGVWTEEDDRAIQSSNEVVMGQVDRFHGGSSVARVAYLTSASQRAYLSTTA